MTKCTARELLEELATTGKCDQCGDRIGESEEYGIYCGCRHHRPCRHRWRTGDGCSICELTQACDAEKAVLVEAIDMAIDTLALDEQLPRPAGKIEAWVEKYGDVTDTAILERLRKTLANTSPSALLAQGERQRKALGHALHLVEHNKANCARCREAHKRIRAALGEEKDG